MALNYQQRLFVTYYLGVSNGNATDAARRAGYAHARRIGSRLLSKVDVQAEIDAKVTEVAMSQEEILARLGDIAASSLDDFIKVDDVDWSLDLRKGKRRGKLHTLKKLKRGKDGTEIEVKDAMPALTKLMEYRGMLKGHSEIELKGGHRVVILPAKRGSEPTPGSAGASE